jgi:hypothetical protein
MSYVDWRIEGPKIAGCSCDYGCPCEFNGRPTRGWCEGLEAQRIERGHFGDVRLDGLVIGARYRWPGAVHEGNGTVQGFIDKRADDRQRDALATILGGKEQEPTTVFNIYGSTIVKELDTVFGDLEFECDIPGRRARFSAPGVVALEVTPILNPVTGKEHRAQIVLPEGFEFRSAEMGSADIVSEGADLGMSYRKVYAALTYAAYGPYGIIETAA